METTPLIAQISNLKDLSTEALRAKWRELYNNEPPAFNRTYLETRLAYRIQELAYGGIPKDTRKRIRALKEELLDNKVKPRIDSLRPPIGAVLVREHKGIEHRVRVLANGFEYQGCMYKSLSAIARHIAGCNWNGPEFFGLRNRKGKR